MQDNIFDLFIQSNYQHSINILYKHDRDIVPIETKIYELVGLYWFIYSINTKLWTSNSITGEEFKKKEYRYNIINTVKERANEV